MITQLYGDLELGFTTSYTQLLDDPTSGSPEVWRPQSPEGWFSFGDIIATDADPQGKLGALIVRDASPGKNLLAAPVDYELIWQYKSPFSGAATFGFWRPVPPPGYAALGDLFVEGAEKPPTSLVTCVSKDHGGRSYVRQAEIGDALMGINGSSLFPPPTGHGPVKVWSIDPPLYPADDTNERIFVPTGRFTTAPFTDKPAPTLSTNLLDLPAAIAKEDMGPDPTMNSFDPPPATIVTTDRAVTVPYFMVTDTARDEAWKITHSPFYKVLRKRTYELVLHLDNSGGQGMGRLTDSVTTGVSQEQSEEFTQTTGMEVSESVGVEVSAGAFGMGASASASSTVSQSIETGYARRYSVTTMRHNTKDVQIEVPAGTAGCLWCDHHELLPVRADGSLVTATSLSFNVNSYVSGSYPPGTEVSYTAADAGPASLVLSEADRDRYLAELPPVLRALHRAGEPDLVG